jgi:hypothetical protein
VNWNLLRRRVFDTGCTVDVSHTFESLHAHVDLDGGIQMEPGDQVLIHGRPIHPPFGERVVERRTATVTRANWLERQWTKLVGNLECLDLLDVSFTERRTL